LNSLVMVLVSLPIYVNVVHFLFWYYIRCFVRIRFCFNVLVCVRWVTVILLYCFYML
jgi:hypothetical protein